MSTIFEQVQFLNTSKPVVVAEQGYNLDNYTGFVLESGSMVKNCDLFVTEEIIEECLGNKELVGMTVLTEGARLNAILDSLFPEGKDYKNIKANLDKIVKANDLSDEELRTKTTSLFSICKKILQALLDLELTVAAVLYSFKTGKVISAGFIASIVTANPTVVAAAVAALITVALMYIVNFIINRLLRFIVDKVALKAAINDTKDIIEQLKKMSNETKDEKLKEKYKTSIEKLEKAIKKYNKEKKEDK